MADNYNRASLYNSLKKSEYSVPPMNSNFVCMDWMLDVSCEKSYCPKNSELVIKNVNSWPRLDYIIEELEKAIKT